MDIRNCKICSRIFVSAGGSICPNCMREIDEMFVRVRDYIYDHEDNDIKSISEATGVPETWIFQFLREGRLILSRESYVFVCEHCGEPIRTGRLCDDCIRKLEKGLKKGLEPDDDLINDGRMYILDRLKNKRINQ